MGSSGSGKTTLAKHLEKNRPETFKRLVTYTTRPKREGEFDGIDYYFVDDKKFNRLKNGMFQTVEKQFPPYKYGGLRKDLDPEKWNVVVVSLEGFLTGLRDLYSVEKGDEIVLMNILIDDKLDVDREDRNPQSEEVMNLITLRNMKDRQSVTSPIRNDTITAGGRTADYVEVPFSSLKKYRGKEIELTEIITNGLYDIKWFERAMNSKKVSSKK